MNVLLVVADTGLESVLKDFFEGRGRTVAVSRDPESAAKELEERAFLYVILDLDLGDGALDLCRAIREVPGDRTYCIVLTPEETVQAMRSAIAAGADDFLAKPVDTAALQLRLALAERRLAARHQGTRPTPEGEAQDAGSSSSRERYFRSLLENSSDLITIVDAHGHILYQTPSSELLLGWDAREMMGWNLVEHIHPDDRERFGETLARAVEESETTLSVQCRIRHRDGDYRSFESLAKNLLSDPVVAGVVVTSRDISEHRRLESELNRERVFFQQLFRNSPTGIAILDPENRIVDANQSFVELFQYELAELRRRPINECIVPDELTEEAERLTHSVLDRVPISHETTRKRRDDSSVDVSVIGYPIEIGGRLIGSFGIYSDITQRKKFERDLFHHAFHDALTGLPNRSLLMQRIDRALRQVKRRAESRFAVLFIDLDRFKVINDSLGHEAGDELLIEMARRLEECVRPGDTTARLGGDEFTIILEDLNALEDTTLVAKRILDSLARPFRISGQELGISGSIGIAYGLPRYENPDDLLRDADLAMYKAKTAGKARYEIFDAEMHKRAMWRLQLETHLRRAIDNQELVLYYQPMVSLKTRKVTGFEALVRWAHPSGKVVAARELIPVCEETGLIIPLGRWVLSEAARQVVDWQTRFPDCDCLVNVNLSASEIAHPDFLREVDRICEETGVHPATIGLEMTEALVMAEEKVADTLWELRKRGFRLFVDDFGTGQASLGALARFPIDALKIDRSFVQKMTPSGGNVEIVTAIVALGETLGISVVAEGVETREQLAQVIRLEVSSAQGFLFNKPLPKARAEKLLTLGPLWKEEKETGSRKAVKAEDVPP